MPDFKIDYGPWDIVFSGKAYGHEVEILTNPENFYVVFIYETIGEKRVSAIVEGYKALTARGPIEAFINTLPKPSLGVIKNNGDKTQKVFFISFEAIYLDFNQEDFLKKLDYSLERNMDSVNNIIELGRTSSIELKELGEVSIKDYFQIIGDPFVMRVLLSPKRTGGLTKIDIREEEAEETTAPKIQLGLTKNREIVIENSRKLYRTRIMGKKENETQYCAYIISENLLLEGKQVIIFDSSTYFDGLAAASKNEFALKEQLVEYEPAGFPVKKIAAKQNLKVSIKDTNTHLLLDMVGCFDKDLEKGLTNFILEKGVNTPLEIASSIIEAKELNDFLKLKAERILNIINEDYGEIFGKNIEVSELIKKWPGTLGKATIIDTKNLSKEEEIILTQTMIRFLSRSIKEQLLNEIAIVVPKADKILKGEGIKESLISLENTGFGFILLGENSLSEEIEDTLSSKMTIINENDVAITTRGKPSYRVLLRPTLSGSISYK